MKFELNSDDIFMLKCAIEGAIDSARESLKSPYLNYEMRDGEWAHNKDIEDYRKLAIKLGITLDESYVK